jgi:chemotaxis protein methyltransferase CheR
MILSKQEFDRFSEIVYRHLGIKMPGEKRTMLSARVHKRLRALEMKTFQEYADFLFSPAGQQTELAQLYDVVTTNKTDFFREPGHFIHLTETVLPGLADRRASLRFWSAGCSSGEEPYTLAMVLRDFQESHSDFRFDILATDISRKALDSAMKAVYREEQVEPVPAAFRRKFLLRSRDRSARLVRISPEIRRCVRFGRLNLMEEDFGIRQPMDLIFCRNVLIYFDKQTQEELIRKFCRHLLPGGLLFLGHSESLYGFDLPLVQVAPTIYRKN